ncbi:MAG: hypothetical protein GXP55_04220 [Deltaproteobacteria bacterium]|nr:hypothetical protein [Deltaproteobacteria bacterium]
MRRRVWSYGIACALAWALGACSGPAAAPLHRSWRIEQQHLPGAILSLWSSSPSDLFAAGGPLRTDGGESLVLHYDGVTWETMTTPGTTLWWIFGFAADDVWATGERGTILHYDGASWSQVETPSHDYTLWGIWGASPDDIWSVGGVAAGGAPSVLRHYDGVSWSDVPGVGRDGELLFKVWGTAADDVWAIGTGGATVHWDGAAWTRFDSGVSARLLTVRGRASDDIYAVGGLGTPTVIHFDGARWSPVALEAFGGLMGVWTAPGQGLAVSGTRGILMTDEGDGWAEPAAPSPTELDLHAVWGDGTGRLYASGGDLLSSAAPEGVILSSERPVIR